MTGSSVVTVKGQIVIPVEIRKKIGIHKGTRVFFEEKDGTILVHPSTVDFIEKTCGIFKGSGLLKLLMEDREKEKRREERKLGRK